MFLAVADRKVISAIVGEPLDPALCILMACEASNRRDLPVFHDQFLRRKFSRNKFLISSIADTDFFLPVLRILEAVYGKVFTDDLIRYVTEDLGRVNRVIQRLMELAAVLDLQEVDGVLQRPPVFSRLKCQRKKLLHILVENRSRKFLFHIIIG